MKFIDKNGRLFGRLSIIDVLVLAVVLVMGAALYVKTNHNPITSTGTPDAAITYQLRARGVRDYVAQAVVTGDKLWDYDRVSSGCLGTITAVETQPAAIISVFADGTVGQAPAEGSVDLLLTVEGSGLVSDGRYLLNRVYDLGVNSSRSYQTKYAQFTATVVEIF